MIAPEDNLAKAVGHATEAIERFLAAWSRSVEKTHWDHCPRRDCRRCAAYDRGTST